MVLTLNLLEFYPSHPVAERNQTNVLGFHHDSMLQPIIPSNPIQEPDQNSLVGLKYLEPSKCQKELSYPT